jgi:hypothetical protein
MAAQLLVVTAAATATMAHPDPSNLAELDCAISAFATEFGAGLFPNDEARVAAALHSALHRLPQQQQQCRKGRQPGYTNTLAITRSSAGASFGAKN